MQPELKPERTNTQNMLYKLAYCSRNRLRGTQVEIAEHLQGILATSRTNNPHLGLTGALLYNSGYFAQVLEGPLQAVEQIFEVIQQDTRHSDVTIVQSGPVSEREFPEWAMAFAGFSNHDKAPIATATFEAAFSQAYGAGEEMLSILKQLIVREDEWVLLDAA